MKVALTHLSEKDAVEEVARLCLVLGDVGVGVHAEDLRRRVDRQVLGVLDVALVLKHSTDNRLHLLIPKGLIGGSLESP